MIDRAIGIVGLALALFGYAIPLVFPKMSKKLGWTVIALGIFLMGCAVYSVVMPVDAQPANPPGDGNCNTTGNGNNNYTNNNCSSIINLGPQPRKLQPNQVSTIAKAIRGTEIFVLVTETNPSNPEIVQYAHDIVNALTIGGAHAEIYDSVASFTEPSYGLSLRTNGHDISTLIKAFSAAHVDLTISETKTLQMAHFTRDRYSAYIGISVGERLP